MKKIFLITFIFLVGFLQAQNYFDPSPFAKIKLVWNTHSVPLGIDNDSTWLSIANYWTFGGTMKGQLKYTFGTPTLGWVLTSDALGNATWQAIAGSGWSLTGNSGTTVGTNFIGTTDNVQLEFKTNNTLSGFIGIPGDQQSSTTFGYNAGGSLFGNSSSGSTAFGFEALQNVTNANNNTAIGAFSFSQSGTGANSTFVGYFAGHKNTQSYNTGVGSSALSNNTSAQLSTAIGYASQANSGGSVGGGNGNTTVGAWSMGIGYGLGNSSLGQFSLYNDYNGNFNVAVGDSAGYADSSGSKNTFIGSFSGGVKTGNNQIAIGYGATCTSSNQIALGNSSITGTTGILCRRPNGVLVDTIVGGSGWLLTGNSGTTPGTNFIGTSDDKKLMFKTDGVISGLLDPDYLNTFFGFGAGYTLPSGTNNTGIGGNALGNVSTGIGNTALGVGAAELTTTGMSNTALGQNSLYMNLRSSGSVAIGNDALYNNIGDFNIGIGDSAMLGNTTGKLNIGIGFQSMLGAQTGSENIGIGSYVLGSNTSGNDNIALGWYGMYYNTSGSYNSAIGGVALEQNTTGSYNVSLGYSSLATNTYGSNNTAVGSSALGGNVSGVNNVSIGFNSDATSSVASGVTALGNNVLFNNMGSFNTALGDSAGVSNTTGTKNTYLGYFANGINTGTNQTAIGSGATSTASNTVILGSGANVGIGSTAPHCILQINSTAFGSGVTRGEQLDQYSTYGSSTLELGRYHGTVASPTTTVANDSLGRFVIHAYDGANPVECGSLACYDSGTVSTGVIPSSWEFKTMNRHGSLVSGLTISPSQRIALPELGGNGSGYVAVNTSGQLSFSSGTAGVTGPTGAAGATGSAGPTGATGAAGNDSTYTAGYGIKSVISGLVHSFKVDTTQGNVNGSRIATENFLYKTYVPYTGATGNITLGSNTLTTPAIYGGTTSSSTLNLYSTSGTGTSDALGFYTGSQNLAMTITSSQQVFIGYTSPTIGETFGVSHNQNGQTRIAMSNNSTGASASTTMGFSNNNGIGGVVGLRGSNNTYGSWLGNGMGVYSQNTAGICIMTDANGPITFCTGTASPAAQRMIINSGGNVGIGTTTPNSLLHVSGAEQLGDATNSGSLTFYNSSSSSYYTKFQASSSASSNQTYTLPTAYPSTSGYPLTSTTGGTLIWAATLTTGSITGVGSTPTASAGTGAGTTPTITVTGTNLSGTLSVATGTTPAGTNATVCTVTYANSLAYPNGSYVILYPANALTATLNGISMVYVAGTTTTFVVTSGTTALTGSSTYLWNYQVTGN